MDITKKDDVYEIKETVQQTTKITLVEIDERVAQLEITLSEINAEINRLNSLKDKLIKI